MLEERVDLRLQSPEDKAKAQKQMQLLFKLNHTIPMTEEYAAALQELFSGSIGQNSVVMTPLQIVCPDKVHIGKNVFINSNCLMMSRGGITIEDDVQIAANVSLISNNHDPYERMVLPCKPVVIKQGAWLGAGATILPGITVGKHAIVGAASVVTKNVPDYAVVAGNPAKVIKTLEADRFADYDGDSEA